MKKATMEGLYSVIVSTRLLLVVLVLYVTFMVLGTPFVFQNEIGLVSDEGLNIGNDGFLNSNPSLHEGRTTSEEEKTHVGLLEVPSHGKIKSLISSLNLSAAIADSITEGGILNSARDAIPFGRTLWDAIENEASRNGSSNISTHTTSSTDSEKCPHSISLVGDEFSKNGRLLVLPCGLTFGSHITVVGKLHAQNEIKISNQGQYVMTDLQFLIELQGLKTVEGEYPPRILHFNPRLKGDWSGKPVIEMNTCYRMQWGISQRCEGLRSTADEETVDDMVKCEKWVYGDDDNKPENSKATWLLSRSTERTKSMVSVDRPFPFVEEKLFVLTLTAGLEGYHVHVDGRHVASFPYRTGFALEDATGLAINGDVDVHYVVSASLPSSHPIFSSQRHLDLSERWKSPPIVDRNVELLIGILSAGNHFAERMAVRKSWMQHHLIKSSKVVARFFVALNARKEVNIKVKKEAEFFGDIVIVPYMDKYDLVVLKTLAICEYGVRTVLAKYILKGDDDTFVRVDAVLDEARKVGKLSSYVGNINYHHRPLRSGKWAVSYEEWPEEDYPPYANGAGYILSYDIAKHIVSDFKQHKLRLFKMEDVSMGTWVAKFNSTTPVTYIHSRKFCQFGCVEGYLTAHYQSPRQMMCLWYKLTRFGSGRPSCCNLR